MSYSWYSIHLPFAIGFTILTAIEISWNRKAMADVYHKGTIIRMLSILFPVILLPICFFLRAKTAMENSAILFFDIIIYIVVRWYLSRKQADLEDGIVKIRVMHYDQKENSYDYTLSDIFGNSLYHVITDVWLYAEGDIAYIYPVHDTYRFVTEEMIVKNGLDPSHFTGASIRESDTQV